MKTKQGGPLKKKKEGPGYLFLIFFAILSLRSLSPSNLSPQHSGLKNCAHFPGPLHSENSIPSALGSHAAISPLALAQSPEAWLTRRNPVVVVHA